MDWCLVVGLVLDLGFRGHGHSWSTLGMSPVFLLLLGDAMGS